VTAAVEVQSVGVTGEHDLRPASEAIAIDMDRHLRLGDAERWAVLDLLLDEDARCTRAEMRHQCGRRPVETSSLPRERYEW
jgi:hypothetical protein